MAEAGETPAITFEERAYSWAKLRTFSEALGRALTAADPAGGAAALVLRNRVASAAAMFALLAARRTGLMITPVQTAAGIRAEVRALSPRVVIAESRDWDGEMDSAA